MKNHARSLVPLLLYALLAACQQTSIAEQERISSAATIQAATPSVTPTAAPTDTPIPTATLTPSPGPTSTPVPPTATPPPPTATPNPSLTGFSFCTQSAGDLASGRFSAQLTAITVTAGLQYDRITLALDVPGTSVAPHATARCLTAGSATTLRLDMPDWLHDARFVSSALTRTVELSGTSGLSAPRFEVSPGDAGAALLLTLDAPRPFKIAYQAAPPQIQVDIARSGQIAASADTLTQPTGDAPKPAAPIFYIQAGDVWSLVDGKSTNLTASAETETALAVAPNGKQIVFCRAAPGTDASDLGAASDLWLQDVGGAAKRISPDSARTCAEPVYSPDGATVAFTASETAANPPRYAIYTVKVSDGTAARVTSPTDEWSRFGPQWLADGKLVYAAQAEDGRSALFTRTPDGREDDIAAKLVVGDRYRAVGRPLASRDGSLIAVEGWRVGTPGADLLLLDPTGAEKQMIGGSYWARPLAWSADGTLFYLTSSCASEVAQSYELRARPNAGSERTLATGSTAGSIGAVTAVGSGVAYVAQSQAAAGPRGPLAAAPGASAIWLWDLSGGGRARLLESPGPLGALGAGS